jgi:hypothetical protein
MEPIGNLGKSAMRYLNTLGSPAKQATTRAAVPVMIVLLSAIVSLLAATTLPASAQPLKQWK